MAENVTIVINAKDNASHAIKGVGNAFSRMGEIAGGILAAGVIQDIGRAMIGVAKDSIKAASDLNETANKIDVVFGSANKTINAFAKNAAKSLGQSTQAALDSAATFGVFGKSAGLTGEELAGFSTDLVQLASDMASFSNTTPEEAVIALGAALRGESEPIRRYGVLLDDASLRQKALEMGIIKTIKNALTPQQRVLAANALIMEQTKDAQGDFARTSTGLANVTRILNAQWENMKTELGVAVLPLLEAGAGIISGQFMPAGIDLINNFIKPALSGFAEFGSKILAVISYLQGGGNLGMGIVSYLFGADFREQIESMLSFFAPLIAGFQSLFGAIMASAPMVIAALQGMFDFLVNVIATYGPVLLEQIGGILIQMGVWWTDHGAQVMAIVGTLWTFITTVITAALLLLSTAFNVTLALINGDATAAWDAFKSGFEAFMNVILALVGSNLTEFSAIWSRNFQMAQAIVMIAFTSIKNTITGLFTQATTIAIRLLNNLADAFEMVRKWIAKVIAMVNSLSQALSNINLPDWLTPGSPTPFENGLRGISMAMDELTGKRLPAFSAGVDLEEPSGMIGGVLGSGAMNARAGNTYNYNLTINEAGSRGDVVRDFGLLQALAG